MQNSYARHVRPPPMGKEEWHEGSEFESVYLCLPPITVNNQGRGLNRELIYTGLTRAKKYFMLFGEGKALSLSLGQQCVRGSGLDGRLLGY